MAKHISVKGMAQGVGFCRFISGIATRLNLRGWVYSSLGGVEIHVDGQALDLDQFIAAMSSEKPPLVKIESIRVTDAPDESLARFEIRESGQNDAGCQPVFADLGICPDCERELFDPQDRRYLYPFISCSRCGPRFAIVTDRPYDRAHTTMADFVMCERCRAEYTDPLDRRFGAGAVACPECGPFVELRETHSQFPTDNPRISSIEIRTSAVLKARRLLREGYIVAIKGLGGFHLACDASNPYTVAELRERRGGLDKPFAVMAANLSVAASVCHIRREEHFLLAGREKPIVLLTRRKEAGLHGSKVSEWVAPNLDTLGVLLPYTPMHHLLLNQTDPVLTREPVPPILVITSGNVEGEPAAAENEEALERLSTLADAFLLHNLHIHMRSDDSVVKVDQGNTIYLRRARGYAPDPVEIPFEVRHVLAVGGDRMNTFCLARGRQAFLSHQIGDLGTVGAQQEFEKGIQQLSQTLCMEPELVAHDLQPDSFTTGYAQAWRPDVPHLAIQHQHAHVASCMADNRLGDRRLIGLAFDGTGYGLDGAIWGGEVLLASYAEFERFAHLEYLPLPGGDSASHSPWRVAVGYAQALGIDIDGLPFLQNLNRQALRRLKRQLDAGHDMPVTSSMGYLFQAVASLIGIRNEVSYEGQAALEIEILSRPYVSSAMPYSYLIEETQSGTILRLKQLLSAVVRDMRAGDSPGVIGARLHRTVVEMTVEICKRARAKTELNEVALSGNVWQNQLLLDLVREGLRRSDFVVYFHQRVPPNDGGLALGQAVIASSSVGIHGPAPAGANGEFCR
jgi:hydrogenase maturation protein HypF